MADHSICLSPTCKAWADGDVSVCPRCGGPMKGGKKATARGWVLLVLGLILVLMMGAIIVAVAPMMLYPDPETFTGTPEQARMFLTLFAVVFFFGVMSMANGLYIIATGRQNKLFTIATFVVAALLVGLTFYILGTTK